MSAIYQRFLDPTKLIRNQHRWYDLLKSLVYHHDSNLFSQLDFDNDRAFSDPVVFHYLFSPKIPNSPLVRWLYGYIPPDLRPANLIVRADRDGLVNLPNLGYLRLKPKEKVKISPGDVETTLLENFYLPESSIRLCIHGTSLLEVKPLKEPPERTLTKHISPLSEAAQFLQVAQPELWTTIERVAREVVVYNSMVTTNLTGLQHHGTLYLNTQGRAPTSVFFVDALVRGCGYLLFDMLMLDQVIDNSDKRNPNPSWDWLPCKRGGRILRDIFARLLALDSLSSLSEWCELLGNWEGLKAKAEANYYQTLHLQTLKENISFLDLRGNKSEENSDGLLSSLIDFYIRRRV